MQGTIHFHFDVAPELHSALSQISIYESKDTARKASNLTRDVKSPGLAFPIAANQTKPRPNSKDPHHRLFEKTSRRDLPNPRLYIVFHQMDSSPVDA